MFGKCLNLNPYEKDFLLVSTIENEKNKRLAWYKKYWPEIIKCEYPANRLQRLRRLTDANLYEEAKDLIIKHEKLLKSDAVSIKPRISHDELYKKDLYETLKNTRNSLCLPNEDIDYQEARERRLAKIKCEINESIRNVRFKTGLIASAIEQTEIKDRRRAYIPSEDYHNFDSESSTIGWKCHEAVKCEEPNRHKNHYMKYFQHPHGVMPKAPTSHF